MATDYKSSTLDSFSMLCGFNVTCLGSDTRSLRQADKTPNTNYATLHHLPLILWSQLSKYNKSMISWEKLYLKTCTISTEMWQKQVEKLRY